MPKLFLIFLVLFLMSCSDNHEDLKKYILEVNAQKPKFIKSLSEDLKVSNVNTFIPASTFNPFYPLKKVLKAEKKFNLEALKFVGLIQQGKEVWALIELSESKTIRIKVGDYLVKNKILVKKVQGNALILEQTIQDAKGGQTLDLVINMSKPAKDS